MKSLFKMVLILALVLSPNLPSATGLSAQSEDVEVLLGTWDIELIEMGMQMQFIFKIEEETLIGELEFEMGSGTMEEIAFKDNTLTFLVSLDAGGQTITVETEATVKDEEMTGTMFTDMGDVGFEGKKRKDT